MQHTLYDMIWNEHLVDEQPDGTCLLYVDRHIVHEVDSPQAFGGLRLAGLRNHLCCQLLDLGHRGQADADHAKDECKIQRKLAAEAHLLATSHERRHPRPTVLAP